MALDKISANMIGTGQSKVEILDDTVSAGSFHSLDFISGTGATVSVTSAGNTATITIAASVADGSISTNKIVNSAVTLAKIQDITTDRLLGRDSGGSGVVEQITVSGGIEFSGSTGIQRSELTGDVTASAGSNATTIANNVVSDAKLRDSAGLSVIGRSANSSGDPADIIAGADGNVMRRSGTAIGFGAILLTSANAVSGILPSANGGTNNGFFTVSGPATSTRTFTFPNANATVLTSNAAVTVAQGGTGATTLTGVLKGNGTSAFTAATAGTDFVTPTGTETLTNKRVNPRVATATSTATLTINSDTTDLYTLTAQAAALTIANPTGTPVQGQALVIRIKDNGTARAITYGANFRAMGTTLKTTTTISKTLYISCIYNSTDTKWDVVGVAQEA